MNKVLIVEDSDLLEDMLECTDLFFEDTAVEFISADNLEEAIEAVLNNQLFAIILDGNLTSGDISGSDGEEIAKKALGLNPELRIIGFSASGFMNPEFWKSDQHFNSRKDYMLAFKKLAEWLA